MLTAACSTKAATHEPPPVPAGVDVEVFYDGDCPLCMREINMLRRKDKSGKIAFTDIAAAEFEAEKYGKTGEQLMSEIHARIPGGEWITGVEVFRRLYSAIGFSALVWPTRLPVVRQMLDVGYRMFAKNRLRLTGRCNEKNCELP